MSTEATDTEPDVTGPEPSPTGLDDLRTEADGVLRRIRADLTDLRAQKKHIATHIANLVQQEKDAQRVVNSFTATKRAKRVQRGGQS